MLPGWETRVSGTLLAGGQSRRMGGRNKALLELGGRTVIERAADVLLRVFREVNVITNSPQLFSFLGLPMFADILPGRGSVGGLLTALTVSKAPWTLIVACDMPFLDERVIRHMLRLVDEHDVIVPRIGAHLEPLHAIYSQRCLPHARQVATSGDLRIWNFYDQVDTLEVPEDDIAKIDPQFRFIINLNTPRDLEDARQLVRQSAQH